MKPQNATWPEYIRNGVGWKISKLGEKIGIDRLTYNRVVMECFHSMAVENAPGLVRSFADTFGHLDRLVDVGCGSGAIAVQFLKAGYSIVGCERSPHGRKLAMQQGLEVVDFDLNHTPPADITGTFDLAYSVEVAEHLEPKLGDSLVDFLTHLSNLIVFTAAQPGQGGVGHINEQPLGYWVERFRRRKFVLDQTSTDHLRSRFRAHSLSPWFSANACVFRQERGVSA